MPHRRSSSRRVRILGVLAAASLAGPAVAEAQTTTTGQFQCRASAIVGPVIGEPQVANDPYTPCRAERVGLVEDAGFDDVGGLTVRVSALAAETYTSLNCFTQLSCGRPYTTSGTPTPAGAAWASAGEAWIVGSLTVEAYEISAVAVRKCVNGRPDIGGFSAIQYLRVNGTVLPVGTNPLEVPLGPLGTLYVNYRRTSGTYGTPGDVLVRALWLDRPDGEEDVVISEARAGVVDGNPCSTA